MHHCLETLGDRRIQVLDGGGRNRLGSKACSVPEGILGAKHPALYFLSHDRPEAAMVVEQNHFRREEMTWLV